MAIKYNAINLAQGFPDFDCNKELVSLVNKYMEKGLNQYAPMEGVLALRDVIAEKTESLYSSIYHPTTEITITSGATQAIYTAITAIIREGDEVIIFDPAYDSYEPAIELNKGKSIHLQLQQPDYSINWAEVEKTISDKTKMIIINTPHNPSGSIMSVDDMGNLERLTRNTNIVIISDEVYEHIVFDDNKHQSVARFPNLAARSFIVSSFGKTYHTTGWKMGYCLAPSDLMEEFRKVHQYVVFSANTAVQYALADFIKKKDHYLGLGEFYQLKRDRFNALIENSNFNFTPSSGTYFQLLNYKNISSENDTEFAAYLTKEIKVATIPISVFYAEKTSNYSIRLCFAKKDETIDAAGEILQSI
jgi:methionine aminotransferase